MNKTFLIGRITKDIELKYTQSNKSVASFTIAVNKYPEGADFINCVVWDKQAENLKKYCGKGSLIAVDGRISTRSYDNQEGKRVYVTEVVANSIQFLDTKKEEIGIKPEDIESDPFADFGEEHNSGIGQEELDLPF
jgi:single-strand DNA-binding protein